MDVTYRKACGEEAAYNFIYEKLVENSDDINGMIAYALYKRDKIDFIRSFRAKHSRSPTNAELVSFHVSSNTDSRLNAYRIQANVIAREFLDISLEEKVNEIENRLLDDYQHSQIGSDLQELKKYWPGVIQGVVSSWVFAFSVGLVLLASALIRLGPMDVYNEMGKIFKGETRGIGSPFPSVSRPRQ
jgi:hypothetical protein